MLFVAFCVMHFVTTITPKAEEACFEMYRTTLDNKTGLPIQVVLTDSKGGSYTYSVGVGKEDYLDLKPGIIPTSVKINALNKQGNPIEASVGSQYFEKLQQDSRSITFKDRDNKTKIDVIIPLPGGQELVAGTEEQKMEIPAEAATKKAGDFTITVKNDAEIAMLVTITDNKNKEYTFSLPAGKKEDLYIPCLKKVHVKSLIRTADELTTTLNINLPCADRKVKIKDRKDHTELLVFVEQGKNLPDLQASSEVVGLETQEQVVGEGKYNTIVENEATDTVIVLLKHKQDNKEETLKLVLNKDQVKTVASGCVQQILLARGESDAGEPYTEITYNNPLSCADHRIKIKDEDAHRRLVLLVDGDRVATGEKPKKLKDVQKEEEAKAKAEQAAQPIQSDIFVWRVKNNAEFPLSLVTLYPDKGDPVSKEYLEVNEVWTPQVGCVKKIVAKGKSIGKNLEVAFDGELPCTAHKIKINDDDNHTRLVIRLDDDKDQKVLAKSAPLATDKEPTPEVSDITVKNNANFDVQITLNDVSTTTVKALVKAKGEYVAKAIKCIKNITVTGTNKDKQTITVKALSLASCPKEKIVLEDQNNQKTLILKVDGQKLAESAKIEQNKLTITNNAAFAATFRLIQTDDVELDPVTVKANSKAENINVDCLKQIFVKATIQLDGKAKDIELAAAAEVPCNTDQTLKLIDDDNRTRMHLKAPGIKNVKDNIIGSSPVLLNDFKINNKTGFAITINLIDDTTASKKITLEKGKEQTVQLRCLKTIQVDGTNPKGQKITVEVSPQLTCENHIIHINDLENKTRLRINVDNRALATSPALTNNQEDIEKLNQQIAKAEKDASDKIADLNKKIANEKDTKKQDGLKSDIQDLEKKKQQEISQKTANKQKDVDKLKADYEQLKNGLQAKKNAVKKDINKQIAAVKKQINKDKAKKLQNIQDKIDDKKAKLAKEKNANKAFNLSKDIASLENDLKDTTQEFDDKLATEVKKLQDKMTEEHTKLKDDVDKALDKLKEAQADMDKDIAQITASWDKKIKDKQDKIDALNKEQEQNIATLQKQIDDIQKAKDKEVQSLQAEIDKLTK